MPIAIKLLKIIQGEWYNKTVKIIQGEWYKIIYNYLYSPWIKKIQGEWFYKVNVKDKNVKLLELKRKIFLWY